MGARAGRSVPPAAELRALLGWLITALGVGAGAAQYLPAATAKAPPAAFSAELGGAFALHAPDGAVVSSASLKGTPFVLMFGYTRCGDPCARRLAQLADWRAALGEAGAGLRIVFITVDPAHDTPKRLSAFVAQFDAPVIALTGRAADVAQAARAYNAVHFKAPLCGGGYTIMHSAAAYLMGSDGRARAIIAEDEGSAGALAKLRRLAAS